MPRALRLQIVFVILALAAGLRFRFATFVTLRPGEIEGVWQGTYQSSG